MSKKMSFFIIMSFVVNPVYADVSAQGYCKKDEVCTQSQYRSDPSAINRDNRLTKGSVNLYLEKEGAKNLENDQSAKSENFK